MWYVSYQIGQSYHIALEPCKTKQEALKFSESIIRRGYVNIEIFRSYAKVSMELKLELTKDEE